MRAQPWTGGELRWDLWAHEWVVVAPARAARPHHVDGPCPFCPGPTEDTPAERWRLPDTDGLSWRVRSVRNRYALSDHHEVVIESPYHDWDLATGTEPEVTDVLYAWQRRHKALRTGAAEVVVFRNKGVAAGISVAHPHSQVVGLPVVSAVTTRELESARRYHTDSGRRAAEDLISGELANGARIVLANDAVVAFVPFAPVTDFEVRIAPMAHRADFAQVPGEELTATGAALRAVLGALRDDLDDPAYNLVLHTAPTGWETAPFLSWHLSVMPRLTVPAGLELATGMPVLTTAPEDCARRLRAALPDHALTR